MNRDFKYKIGAKAFWVPKPWEPDGVQLFYYPDILLSYNSKKSVVQPYLTVSGGLHANSYTSLSLQNPFIAPSANLRPQEERYKVCFGFNTQFNLGIDFWVGGAFTQIQPVFRCLGVLPIQIAPREYLMHLQMPMKLFLTPNALWSKAQHAV